MASGKFLQNYPNNKWVKKYKIFLKNFKIFSHTKRTEREQVYMMARVSVITALGPLFIYYNKKFKKKSLVIEIYYLSILNIGCIM